MKDKEKQNISMKEMLTKRSFEPITNCNCVKDKENQIEEMGKDVCENINTKMCANGTCPKIWDCPYSNTMAEILIEKGYRKLPKDSIVLSMEELEKDYVPRVDYVFAEMDYEHEKNYMCKLFMEELENARKETAEKFLQLAYDRCLEKSFIKKVEELAKSLGAEIKEKRK